MTMLQQIHHGRRHNPPRLLIYGTEGIGKSTTAVKIARSELSAICHAVGVMQPRDSVELHNLPLVIVVKLRKREDTGELTNEIKGYERKAPAGQTQQAPVTDNTPPWKR